MHRARETMHGKGGRSGRQRPQRRRRALILLPAVIALAGSLAGCSARSAPAPGQPATTVGIVLHDFKIVPGATRVAAGRVTFDVSNNGPATHEFNVDRTNLAADSLPIDSTGLQLDSASPQLQHQGSIESLGLGASRRLSLDLKPGHYVFYCNLPGHYLSGMRVSLDVY
jgi:uncharacterized cupredoxin-like copper-binding protein